MLVHTGMRRIDTSARSYTPPPVDLTVQAALADRMLAVKAEKKTRKGRKNNLKSLLIRGGASIGASYT